MPILSLFRPSTLALACICTLVYLTSCKRGYEDVTSPTERAILQNTQLQRDCVLRIPPYDSTRVGSLKKASAFLPSSTPRSSRRARTTPNVVLAADYSNTANPCSIWDDIVLYTPTNLLQEDRAPLHTVTGEISRTLSHTRVTPLQRHRALNRRLPVLHQPTSEPPSPLPLRLMNTQSCQCHS